MKKLLILLLLCAGCATQTPQRTEFKTVSTATAAVEAARGAYYNIRVACVADPQTTSLCPQIIAAHDRLMTAYGTYQKSVQLLADANIAAINLGLDPMQSADVAAAATSVMNAAADFVALKNDVMGGK